MNKTDTVSGFAGAPSLSFYIHHWIKKSDVKDVLVGVVVEERKKGYKSLKWA